MKACVLPRYDPGSVSRPMAARSSLRHLGVAREGAGKPDPFRQRDVAGVLHGVVRRLAAELRRQAHHHRLRHDQPAGRIQVAPHPRGVDDHSLGDGARVLGGAVRQHETLRQSQRLRLPRTGRALLVGGHRALHQRHQRLHARARRPGCIPRRSDCASAALSRSRRAPRVGLGDLRDLGLREQDDVGRDLGEAAADQAEKAHRLRHPSRATCQGAAGAASRAPRASPAITATPRSPSEASVPAAPPNCTNSTRGRSWSSR